MSANNGRTRPNKFVPEGGGGWKKLVTERPKQSSNDGRNKRVLQQLNELFGVVFDKEIIHSVASSCSWNTNSAIEALMEMSKCTKVSSDNESSMNTSSKKPAKVDQAKSKSKKKEQISVPQALDAIKIAYEGYDDSSDDADIIIEEVEEFEVVQKSSPSPSSVGNHVSRSPLIKQGKTYNECKKIRKYSQSPTFTAIHESISRGIKILILMRGVPGSGKSYLARHVIRTSLDTDPSGYIFSADDFFCQNGHYVFNSNSLSEAHEWNRSRVNIIMQQGLSPVVVDNTNTQGWEMKPYLHLAMCYGYAIELLEPNTPWCWKESELAQRNVHGVPRQQIHSMLERYEKHDVGRLLSLFNMKYEYGNTPPQRCTNPPNVKQIKKLKEVTNSPKKKSASQPARETVKISTTNGGSKVSLESNIYSNIQPMAQRAKKTSSPNAPLPYVFNDYKDPPLNNMIKMDDPWEVIQCTTSCMDNTPIIPLTNESNKQLEEALQQLVLGDVSISNVELIETEPASIQVQQTDYTIQRQDLQKMKNDLKVCLRTNNSVNTISLSSAPRSHLDLMTDMCKEDILHRIQERERLREVSEEVTEDDRLKILDQEVDDMLDEMWEHIVQFNNHVTNCDEVELESKCHVEAEEEERGTDNIETEPASVDETGHKDLSSDVAEIQETPLLKQDEILILDDSNGNIIHDKSIKEDDSCVEYALVMADSSIVDQKSHDETNPKTEGVPQGTIDDAPNILGDSSLVDTFSEQITVVSMSNQLVDDMPSIVTEDDQKIPDSEITLDTNTMLDLTEENNDFVPISSNGLSEPSIDVLQPVVTTDLMDHVEVKEEVETLSIDSRETIVPVSLVDILERSHVVETNAQNEIDLNVNIELIPATPLIGLPDVITYEMIQTADTELSSYNEKEVAEHAVLPEEIPEIEPIDSEEANLSNQSVKQGSKEDFLPKNTFFSWLFPKKSTTPPKPVAQQHWQLYNPNEEGTNCNKSSLEPDQFKSCLNETIYSDAVEVSENKETAQSNDLENCDISLAPASFLLDAHDFKQEMEQIPDVVSVTESEDIKLNFMYQNIISHMREQETIEDAVTDEISIGIDLVKDIPDLSISNLNVDCWAKLSPTHLLSDEITNNFLASPTKHKPSGPEMKDGETNTAHSDFTLLDQDNATNLNVLNAHNRSINTLPSSKSVTIARALPLAFMLDKGSMTSPIDDEPGRYDFDLLVNMFPKIPKEELKDVFDKCRQEINWAVELLLESGYVFEPSDDLEIRFDQTEDLQLLEELNSRDLKLIAHDLDDEIKTDMDASVSRVKPSAHALKSLSFKNPEVAQSEEVAKIHTSSPLKKAPKKQSQLTLQLKKQMEDNIVINPDCYTEETMRIKKIRQGETYARNDLELPTAHIISKLSTQLDNLDGSQELETDLSVEEEEGSVPLTLDPAFLEKLESLFGEVAFAYPEGVSPVVDLPVALARQIHGYLIESLQQQLEVQELYFENMIKDEEYARRLQEEMKENDTPNLQEIMDMEMALELYQSERSNQHKETKEDMATRLSKRKLVELYPSVDEDMLFSIFAAHNYAFKETLEILQASTGQPEEPVKTVMSPEALIAYEKQLIDRAKEESVKQCEMEDQSCTDGASGGVVTSPKDQAMKDAQSYRNEANHLSQLRNECFQKANTAHRNGQQAVASYYAQVGHLYKQRIESANSRAASALLSAHSLEQRSTTLDLHYLYVAEALEALDIFIDYHIASLLDNISGPKSKALFLITGSGQHSVGGQPRIKPAVQKRLQQRKMKFQEVNPGLLKAIVTRSVHLSSGAK